MMRRRFWCITKRGEHMSIDADRTHSLRRDWLWFVFRRRLYLMSSASSSCLRRRGVFRKVPGEAPTPLQRRLYRP